MDTSDKRHDIEAVARALALPRGVALRAWEESDFPAVQRLSAAEGWPTPLDRPGDSLEAWRHSWPTLAAVINGEVIGFLRALSDGMVTTYVAELLIAPEWRRQGLASALLDVSQRLCPGSRLDLLATTTSRPFYERAGFRPFAGFRRGWLDREAIRFVDSTQDAT